MSAAFLQACRAAVGDAHVVTGEAMAPYLEDWRGRFTGAGLAVVSPGSTEEVAAIVRACAAHRVPLVPQGGRTGLVLGSVPDSSGSAIVLSLRRMRTVRKVDLINRTMTVDAGCLLHDVQQAAQSNGCLFPLSLASEGSCTIGGNLATNAGGTAVLRYGNARDLCLGLEVVTAGGEIWDGLRGLRKDNTGYDLRDLFIGSEGTLGVITGAVLKLFPQPRSVLTALAGVDSPAQALALLSQAQDRCGASLTGFELMSDYCLELVATQFPQLGRPLTSRNAYAVLLELSSNESEQHAAGLLEATLDGYQDAVVATSMAQASALWQVREHIPLAQAKAGKNIKHDISVPLSRIAAFIDTTAAALAAAFPGSRLVCFGHLGDGNLHYNVEAPLSQQEAVNRIVHDSVAAHGGSISAEHGIGALKTAELARYAAPVELAMMRSIKQALDPLNLMNPGKILA